MSALANAADSGVVAFERGGVSASTGVGGAHICTTYASWVVVTVLADTGERSLAL
jgi:hypothetical protein